MRIRRIDRKIERDILIALITNKQYLSTIRPVLNTALFKNNACRTVVSWIIEYFDKYNEAPGQEIEKIYNYHERQGDIKDEDEVDLIKDLLQSASDQYCEAPNLNVQFLIDKTEEYFNRILLERTFGEAQDAIERGDIQEAKNLVTCFKEIKIGEKKATDGLVSEEELQEAFAENEKPLFTLPGGIGEMVNTELTRDKFIALQAPEKSGKTFFLLWLALRALRARLKVVMFELEMTKNQVNRRMSISISGINNLRKYCDGKNTPKKFVKGNEGIEEGAPAGYSVIYEDEESVEPLIWQTALQHNKDFYHRFHLRKDKHWRLITAPARSLNIRQIDAELERLEKEENFVADVVLIDYMDILGPENTREQDRERINSNWVAAKAMCNKRHIFLASVTQSSAMAYEQDLQTRSSFSEDHRKYAHTNGTLGLTQTAEDKRNNIAKLNWLVLREGEFNERRVCFILQCLKRGRFCIDSVISDYTPRKTTKRFVEEDETPKPSKRRNLRER